MPYAISWLVEKRVVYTRLYGFVSGEELQAQSRELEGYVHTSEQLLYIITDATDTTGTNMGLRDLQKTQFADAPNLGWSVYISPKNWIAFLRV